MSSANKKLALMRLQKQKRRMHDDPLQNVWVARQGALNFHFCIYGLDGAYEGGFYHGVLELHEDYPFAPPKLMFFTLSGRFEVSKPICTTFTNFHKESWSSGWTVRSMIMATISFMTSDQQGAGGVSASSLTRRQFAKNSMASNLSNPLFKQLFRKEIKKLQTEQPAIANPSSSEPSVSPTSKVQLYFLYILLAILLILWLTLKQ